MLELTPFCYEVGIKVAVPSIDSLFVTSPIFSKVIKHESAHAVQENVPLLATPLSSKVRALFSLSANAVSIRKFWGRPK
jgi:hypothetical protein